MPVSEPKSAVAPAIDPDRLAALRVDCYVRSTVPAPISGTVTDVVDRLRHLSDIGAIAAVRVANWPSECRPVDEPTGEGAPTRDELVAEFERWAARHGHSIEPAFHRREVSVSPVGTDGDETAERVRVPLIALALYETESGDDAGTGELRGVVPYTDRSRAERERTYTVTEWLESIEPSGGDERTGVARTERSAQLRGSR